MKGKPNFLLITTDQQHWNTLGVLNDEIKTPNLDRLAARGTMFTRAYCVNPTCTPTRASIITGKYPSQHGAWSLGTKLSEDEPTVGARLQRDGYETALIGKAHFQPIRSSPGHKSLEGYPVLQDLDFWRGFKDDFYGFGHVELARNHADEPLVGQHYAIWMEEKGFKDWRKCFRKPTGTSEPQRHKWNIPEEYHYSTWIAERSNLLLEEYSREDARFFLWASFFDPHPAYLAPEPWDTMYDPEKITVPEGHGGEHENNPPHFKKTQEADPDFSEWSESGYAMHGFTSHLHKRKDLAKDVAVYYGMVSLTDKYIGRILDRLEDLGLAENTVVIFTTDHGHLFGQHGLAAKGPFHYEDLIKVPMIVSWPGKVPGGRMTSALQSLVDLAPTMLSLSGAEIPLDMSGVDQSGVWLGREDMARDHVVVENRHEPTTIHLKTYVDERYKITVYYNRDYGEIFDLEKDPGEKENLWAGPAREKLKAELIRKLLFAEMGKEPLRMRRQANA